MFCPCSTSGETRCVRLMSLWLAFGLGVARGQEKEETRQTIEEEMSRNPRGSLIAIRVIGSRRAALPARAVDGRLIAHCLSIFNF